MARVALQLHEGTLHISPPLCPVSTDSVSLMLAQHCQGHCATHPCRNLRYRLDRHDQPTSRVTDTGAWSAYRLRLPSGS